MRLAVFDTNVIVSAGVKPGGVPAKILMDWALAGHVLAVTSPAIVEEYREVAQRPKFRRYGFPPLWLELLIEESVPLPDSHSWPHACPDPSDAPFLALAHAAGAWLVTGNLKHFPKSIRNGVKVISLSDYLALLLGE
jgi:putative PIN family toxin of toxin-antitoxin system